MRVVDIHAIKKLGCAIYATKKLDGSYMPSREFFVTYMPIWTGRGLTDTNGEGERLVCPSHGWHGRRRVRTAAAGTAFPGGKHGVRGGRGQRRRGGHDLPWRRAWPSTAVATRGAMARAAKRGAALPCSAGVEGVAGTASKRAGGAVSGRRRGGQSSTASRGGAKEGRDALLAAAHGRQRHTGGSTPWAEAARRRPRGCAPPPARLPAAAPQPPAAARAASRRRSLSCSASGHGALRQVLPLHRAPPLLLC